MRDQLFRIALIIVWAALGSLSAWAQEKCLNDGRLEAIKTQIAAGGSVSAANTALTLELTAFSKELTDAINKSQILEPQSEKVKRDLAALESTITSRICSLLNAEGWPKRSLVGTDGAKAFVYLISRAFPLKMQLEIYPLVSEAYLRGEIDADEVLASYVDRLRLAIGRKQLYGTQVSIKDGFLVTAPIEVASEVDKRRALFKMTPLRTYERRLEITYKMPLIRAVMEPTRGTEQQVLTAAKTGTTDTLGQADDEAPVINVETAFVSIDVNIPDTADAASANLEKSDFKLLDNGKPVEIETFAKADAPFDIVLMLDLSGSTSDKVGLIKKTTRRFVELKRPADRVAVIAFDDDQTVVSELESDQAVLLDRIKKIDGRGGSAIWEAVKFGLDMLETKSEKGRRRALVLMSDGADNLLTFYPTLTQRTGFADLIEQIQNSNVSVFPIYLDTEGPGSARVYENARKTLAYMAEQSGGSVYTAKKIDDLTGIYDRVLKGVGTTYTIGFTPDVDAGDRKWRTLKVEIPSRPALKLRHRPGYFTK